MIFNLWLFCILLGLSYVCTGLFRSYALKKDLIDLPNDRSSHTIPTPRGGGMVFVLLGLAVWISLLVWQHINHMTVNSGNYYCLLPSMFIAILGFVDDKNHLSARVRLIGQVLAFSVFLYWLLALPFLNYSNHNLLNDNLWFLGFSYLFLLWLTNLFNFMDGINGIAVTEAVFFLASITVFYSDMLFYPLSDLTWMLCPLLIGFLLWNFPKAKLFMGDVGSGFLGAFIALICIYLATTSWTRLMVCVILLAVFITDATLTLIIRLYNGDNIFQAHRTHAYQHASRHFESHVPVTLGVTAINVFWILPWAYVVAVGMIKAIVAVFIVYAPVALLAFYFKAGKKEAINEAVSHGSLIRR